jgi:aminopeptidase N
MSTVGRGERRVRSLVVALVVAVASVAILIDDQSSTTSVAAPDGAPTTVAADLDPSTVGGRGAGDPYFPDLGNEGYDVAHYLLDLRWLADVGELRGTATVEATSTHALRRFDLDLVGMEVDSVDVDGEPATFDRDGRELIITPATEIAAGAPFSTTVVYGGRPTTVQEGTDLFDPGWQIDGREAYVVSEPTGAATFFPSNDHPSDKATYSITVTAPSDQTVASNGAAAPPVPGDDGTTSWSFEMGEPMATYLVQIAIGDYELVDDGVHDGVHLRHAIHRDGGAAATAAAAGTAKLLDFLVGVFGPFPFEQYGIVAIRESIGFALETQTLTLVPIDTLGTDRGSQVLLLHELAHQWVGDSVSVKAWRDIWLNEGMATYAEWLFDEADGLPAAETARAQRSAGLGIPAGDPGAGELFPETVYARGALTLQALREAVGDQAFFEILRRWVHDNAGRSVGTADFVALAEDVSGQDLGPLFHAWLDNAVLPSLDG